MAERIDPSYLTPVKSFLLESSLGDSQTKKKAFMIRSLRRWIIFYQ